MPCHSPTKARVMRSRTSAPPRLSILMLSWKSVTRHDFPWAAAVSTVKKQHTATTKDRRRALAQMVIGLFKTASPVCNDASEFHLYRFAIGFGSVEELPLCEAEH